MAADLPDEAETMAFDRGKFAAVVQHIIARTSANPDALGKTKLHKCLYYSDMLCFIQTGEPLTGEDYIKQPFGPTSRRLASVLNELARDGAISIQVRPYFGLQKFDFRMERTGASNALTSAEVGLIDAVVDWVCGFTANEISELSHAAPWRSVELGARIPYFSAFWLLPDDGPSEAAVAAGAAEAKRLFHDRARAH